MHHVMGSSTDSHCMQNNGVVKSLNSISLGGTGNTSRENFNRRPWSLKSKVPMHRKSRLTIFTSDIEIQWFRLTIFTSDIEIQWFRLTICTSDIEIQWFRLTISTSQVSELKNWRTLKLIKCNQFNAFF